MYTSPVVYVHTHERPHHTLNELEGMLLSMLYLCFPIQSVQILSQGSIGETFSTGFESLLKYFHFGMESILHIMIIATALTILRLVLEWTILKASFLGFIYFWVLYILCCMLWI